LSVDVVNVLLVEDHLADIAFVDEALSDARGSQFRLTHVTHLEEAFRHLPCQDFDVVLLDLGLPDSQGLDTFTRLHDRCPRTPIIVFSGLDDDDIALQAVIGGAQDVFVKRAMDGRALVLTIRYAIERARASEQVAASEASYRRLFENSQDGIFILDALTGQINDANPILEKLLGHPVSEFIGKRLWEIAPFRETGASRAAFHTLTDKGSITYKEIPLMTREGEKLIVEFVSNVYEVGNHQVIRCNVHDITERKRSEDAIRVSESEFRTLADSMPQIVWVTQPDGWSIYSNQRWVEYTGLSVEESLGRGWNKPFHPEDQQRAIEGWQKATVNKEIYSGESRLRRADGVYRWWLIRGVPLKGADGNIAKWYGTCTDIHDLKLAELEIIRSNQEIKTLNDELEERVARRTEDLVVATKEAERANNSKSEFLSRMSHELRTPLNAILGFGQILDMEVLDPRSKESIAFILKGGRHLLGLINEVLDLALVESGGAELSIEPVSLMDVVEESYSLVRPLASDQKIKLRKMAAPEGQAYVKADAQRLKQVLINLLSNAIKYNRPGGEVEIGWASASNDQVEIYVRDSGLGIKPEDMLKLFTPFERLGFGHSTVQGTGLGLVISKRLVEAMGGQLVVASTPNVGTTFSVELPVADPIELPASDSNIVGLKPVGCFERRYTVLAIEDNASNLRLLEVVLERRPEISLLSAIQGSIGLDLASQFVPDLILLDLNLPDMSGMQVLGRLRNSDVTRAIPVVIVSADATQSQIERLLHAGAADYLTKPFDIQRLLTLLNDHLSESVRNAQPSGSGDGPAKVGAT